MKDIGILERAISALCHLCRYYGKLTLIEWIVIASILGILSSSFIGRCDVSTGRGYDNTQNRMREK